LSVVVGSSINNSEVSIQQTVIDKICFFKLWSKGDKTA